MRRYDRIQRGTRSARPLDGAKALQGSQFANDEQAHAFNQLVVDGKVDPCLTRTFRFEEIARCHELLENRTQVGNMAALVGAPEPGLTDLPPPGDWAA